MKKRLLALLLCGLMVASSFIMAGCADDSGSISTGIDPTLLTEITIYGIREPETTDEAIEKVEEALTEIAARKYKISINLLLFPEEEYASIIYNKTQSAMAKYNTDVQAAIVDEASDDLKILKNVVYDDDVRVATDLPSEVANANLDLFLVYTPEPGSPTLDPESEYYNKSLENGGMFETLYAQNALAGLDSYIKTGNYSALKSTAYTEALEYLQRETYKSLLDESAEKTYIYDYYGIPNNYAYGSYQFILFDNEYVDPLFSAEDKSLLAKPKQGDADPAELRALKQELTALQTSGKLAADVAIEKTFADYEEYNEYVRNGGKFCIGLINGDRSILDLCAASGKYDVYIRSVNKVKTVDLCESMFCVSPSTITYNGRNKDDSRLKAALNVLLLINTDETFRNILQYGVKDTHYNLGKDGIAHITGMPNDKYVMNPKYCGNMFLIYPSDDMDAATQLLASDNWLLGKLQANDVIGAK